MSGVTNGRIHHQSPVFLFVCTGNAGRSQLAEAYCRRRLGEDARVLSAGVEPWADLHPVAVTLLRRAGFDPAGHFPKAVTEFADTAVDVLVTIGEPARQQVPSRLRSGKMYRHWDIADPAEAEPGEVAASFERSEQLILSRLEVLLAELALLWRAGA